jgi:hypothetical protein
LAGPVGSRGEGRVVNPGLLFAVSIAGLVGSIVLDVRKETRERQRSRDGWLEQVREWKREESDRECGFQHRNG